MLNFIFVFVWLLVVPITNLFIQVLATLTGYNYSNDTTNACLLLLWILTFHVWFIYNSANKSIRDLWIPLSPYTRKLWLSCGFTEDVWNYGK